STSVPWILSSAHFANSRRSASSSAPRRSREVITFPTTSLSSAPTGRRTRDFAPKVASVQAYRSATTATCMRICQHLTRFEASVRRELERFLEATRRGDGVAGAGEERVLAEYVERLLEELRPEE